MSFPRNIRRASILLFDYLCLKILIGTLGKYIVEKERIVKENAWSVED
jgi:hypothetical protein